MSLADELGYVIYVIYVTVTLPVRLRSLNPRGGTEIFLLFTSSCPSLYGCLDSGTSLTQRGQLIILVCIVLVQLLIDFTTVYIMSQQKSGRRSWPISITWII